jgi:hypothetical protein
MVEEPHGIHILVKYRYIKAVTAVLPHVFCLLPFPPLKSHFWLYALRRLRYSLNKLLKGTDYFFSCDHRS